MHSILLVCVKNSYMNFGIGKAEVVKQGKGIRLAYMYTQVVRALVATSLRVHSVNIITLVSKFP